MRYGDFIQVASGRRFYTFDPREDEIDIETIAHALSHLCRYTGHTSEFYSVGEHSVRVSLACDPADALWGLLHDASEAFTGDLARPIKRMPEMAAFRAAEDRIMAAVCRRFGLPPEMPASVRRADEILLATEARDLMAPLDPGWAAWLRDIPALPGRIVPWTPGAARAVFVDRFVQLTSTEPL